MLEWSTVADADHPGRVEPNAGKKAVGFDDGEAPAASEHNWLFGLAGDWIRYFDDVAAALLGVAPITAFKNVTNLFTATQQIEPASAADPMLASSQVPSVGGWLEALQVACGATFTARLFWGSSDTGLFAVTLNAFWNDGTSLWAAEDTSKDSFALLLRRHAISSKMSVVASARAAGAGTWPTWPNNAGDVSAGGDFLHASSRPRQTQINVLAIVPLSGTWSIGPGSGVWEAGAGGDEMLIPLRLPHGMTMARILVQHNQTSTAPNEFNLLARRKTDWPAFGASPSSPALPAHGPSEYRMSVIGPGSIGTFVNVSAAAFTVDNHSETYILHCIAGAAGNALPLSVLVEWLDTGPTNQ